MSGVIYRSFAVAVAVVVVVVLILFRIVVLVFIVWRIVGVRTKSFVEEIS